MSAAPPMPLAEARAVAEEIVAWLRPVTERCEIAGSIRREAAQVHDIEIVCVPKVEVGAINLFGDAYVNLFGEAYDTYNALDGLIEWAMGANWGDAGSPKIEDRTDKNGRPARGTRYKRLLWNGVPLDLFSVLPPAQWGVIFAIRTGPADFSRRLVTFKDPWLRVRDGRLEREEQDESQQPGLFVWRGVSTPEEVDFFREIGLPWIEPADRR